MRERALHPHPGPLPQEGEGVVLHPSSPSRGRGQGEGDPTTQSSMLEGIGKNALGIEGGMFNVAE